MNPKMTPAEMAWIKYIRCKADVGICLNAVEVVNELESLDLLREVMPESCSESLAAVSRLLDELTHGHCLDRFLRAFSLVRSFDADGMPCWTVQYVKPEVPYLWPHTFPSETISGYAKRVSILLPDGEAGNPTKQGHARLLEQLRPRKSGNSKPPVPWARYREICRHAAS